MDRRMTTGMAVVAALAALVSAPPAAGTARVLDLGPLHGASVARAVAGAARRLERAECRRIFADFRDASGTMLQDRLDALGLEGADYLRWVVFTDGFGHRSCRQGDALALTSPGRRVVYVCGPRFQRAQARDPTSAEIVVLHEALHTLGLGENPPRSLEITRQVNMRCGD